MLYSFCLISVWLKYLIIKKRKKETREATGQWKIDNGIFYSEELTSILKLGFKNLIELFDCLCEREHVTHCRVLIIEKEEGGQFPKGDSIYPTLNSIGTPNISCGKKTNSWGLKFMLYVNPNWSQMTSS